MHALVAGSRERGTRSLRELRDHLDRVHLGCELGEHCRLVARAGADVENTLAAFQREPLTDEGDDERLRDGLAVRKRQCRILVGEVGELRWDETLAWDTRHRSED